MREYAWLVLSVGLTASLGATYGFAFVFDAEGNPMVGTQLVADGDSMVIFGNVDISSDVMPTATSNGGACALELPSAVYPSQAKVFTAVDMICP